jgi:rare lipoprotein A
MSVMPFHLRPLILSLLLGLLASCGVKKFHRPLPPVMEFGVIHTQVGIASIYKDRRTASGERFHASALTAAHRTWPMGTRVRVTHLGNGRTVIVRINDRGPFIRDRVIDLTPAAASAIGLSSRQGVAQVRLERLR